MSRLKPLLRQGYNNTHRHAHNNILKNISGFWVINFDIASRDNCSFTYCAVIVLQMVKNYVLKCPTFS